MRCLVGFICVLALRIMLMSGCSDTEGTGGSGGAAGDGGRGGTMALCEGNVCQCSEAGIRAAIEAGGDDPYTFDCDGPQTVVTEAEIVIDNDVTLDGEGFLIVDGDHQHRVFSVPEGVTAALHGFAVQHGSITGEGGGIANEGVLTIRDCLISSNSAEWEPEAVFGSGAGMHNGGKMAIFDTVVSRNRSSFGSGAGIHNAGEMSITDSLVSDNSMDHGSGGGVSNAASGTLRLMTSTVSDNHGGFDGSGEVGGGIYNAGEMTVLNSTVSGNSAMSAGPAYGGGIANVGKMSILSSTVSDNSAAFGGAIGTYSNPHAPDVPYLEMANTLIKGDCDEFLADALRPNAMWVSNGHNIESPLDTCGFDHGTDLVNITEGQLDLGPLQYNGGPTTTHALDAGSVAIDHIPAVDCEVTEDQRGEPRPGGTMCDVGSFEVQP